jgi:hypothetical protein
VLYTDWACFPTQRGRQALMGVRVASWKSPSVMPDRHTWASFRWSLASTLTAKNPPINSHAKDNPQSRPDGEANLPESLNDDPSRINAHNMVFRRRSSHVSSLARGNLQQERYCLIHAHIASHSQICVRAGIGSATRLPQCRKRRVALLPRACQEAPRSWHLLPIDHSQRIMGSLSPYPHPTSNTHYAASG